MNEERMSEMTGMGLTGADQMSLQEQESQQQQSQENPFNAPEYQQMQSPDAPIQYGGGMAEMLLSDSEVPESLRKKYWWIFNRDNVLTFLDNDRKERKMMAFDVAIIDNMNSMETFNDYNFESESQFNLMRYALDVKLDRAVGFNGSNMKNERVILQSQFNESKQISEMGENSGQKEGFFKRLLGRR